MNKKVLFLIPIIFFSTLLVGFFNRTIVHADAAAQQKCEDGGGTYEEDENGGGTCICDGDLVDDGNGSCVLDSTTGGGSKTSDPLTVDDADGQKIIDWINDGLNLLSALAGLAITAAVIIGGIQYSTSGGNPQAAAAAKKRISNAILALVAFVFLFTFLQWLVPGGIFQ